MNQLFGYQILPGDASMQSISFEEAQAILVDGKYGQVKIFAEPNTQLQGCFSQQHKAYAYVWGIPAHPRLLNPKFRNGV